MPHLTVTALHEHAHTLYLVGLCLTLANEKRHAGDGQAVLELLEHCDVALSQTRRGLDELLAANLPAARRAELDQLLERWEQLASQTSQAEEQAALASKLAIFHRPTTP